MTVPTRSPVIGIAGGMGPHAGLDLHGKILEMTRTQTDQGHLPVLHISFSEWVADRTAYLFDRTLPNPANGIFETIAMLDKLGAAVIGIPCNTAHSPEIFSVVRQKMKEANLKARLLNLVDEVVDELLRRDPRPRRIGVLATNGTWRAKVYENTLNDKGFTAVVPDWDVQDACVQSAIYDPIHGIKAQSAPVTEEARTSLLQAACHLKVKGAELVLLACTELPIALPEPQFQGLELLDATRILAGALIRETCPEKLGP